MTNSMTVSRLKMKEGCKESIESFTRSPPLMTQSFVKYASYIHSCGYLFHNVMWANLQLAKTEGNVYATDSILATLMCSIRSNYSWDIIVQKVGGKLFFDKRDDSEFGMFQTLFLNESKILSLYIFYLDLLTVSETSNEPPQEEGINSPRNLALEATFINHNLSQQVLKMVREVV